MSTTEELTLRLVCAVGNHVIAPGEEQFRCYHCSRSCCRAHMGNPDANAGDLVACVDHVAEVARAEVARKEAELHISRLQRQGKHIPVTRNFDLLDVIGMLTLREGVDIPPDSVFSLAYFVTERGNNGQPTKIDVQSISLIPEASLPREGETVKDNRKPGPDFTDVFPLRSCVLDRRANNHPPHIGREQEGEQE